tara:strand:- start:55114 stop:55416 length:303 start_codon:yes stop_codon:yes gene_type:complete
MFKRRQNEAYKRVILQEAGGDKATVESVLNLLLDDGGYYRVTKWDDYYEERTVWQRIVFCLLFPFLLLSLPFQWILTGKTGITSKTKLGRFILDITGTKY